MNSIRLSWYRLVTASSRTVMGWLIMSFLWYLSWFYGFALLMRRIIYRLGLVKQVKLACPVISIGNITVGGTGKTPLVEYLARYLADRKQPVVILARGYGLMTDKTDDETVSFTHPLVRRLTGANRVALGREVSRKQPAPVILLDDGFQHWRLQRDLDIVVVDSLQPFGNRCLLPAGLLREPLPRLRRADLFVLTHTDLVPETELMRLVNYLAHFGKPVVKSIHHPTELRPSGIRPKGRALNLPELKDKKIWAFCGIGNPESFRRTLEKSGANLVGFDLFPDHYLYTAEDIRMLSEEAHTAGAEYLVTTRKDLIKIPPETAGKPPLYALQIELLITDGKEVLEDRLMKLRG